MEQEQHPGKSKIVLAGDIGGTKMHLALFIEDSVRPRILVSETYLSREVDSFEHILGDFVSRHSKPISAACFGVAGPVFEGESHLVNLSWVISAKQLKARFGWERVSVLNDLTVTAMSVSRLSDKELSILNSGQEKKNGNIGLVAPGTGLGQALLIYGDRNYYPVASEGGHADFAPTESVEVDLWRYLNKRFGHVSIERVLSGPGLVNIYEWLKESRVFEEKDHIREQMASKDPARIISKNAGEGKDPLCTAAVHRFCRILGAVAGNLALVATTGGGIYLGGGIPPKILSFLEESEFMDAFTGKGRFSDFMRDIPVRIILNQEAALLGAGICAFNLCLSN
jgi:glucokinase